MYEISPESIVNPPQNPKPLKTFSSLTSAWELLKQNLDFWCSMFGQQSDQQVEKERTHDLYQKTLSSVPTSINILQRIYFFVNFHLLTFCKMNSSVPSFFCWQTYNRICFAGAYIKFAKTYGALIFAVEHRFYGQSLNDDGLKLENLKYLSSQQAYVNSNYSSNNNNSPNTFYNL